MGLREHNESVISRHDAYLTASPYDDDEGPADIEAEEEHEAAKEDAATHDITDADMIFNMNSRDEADTVSLRCQKFDDGIWCDALIDCDTGHFCGSMSQNMGPFETFDEAFWGCCGVFDWFGNNGVRGYWCGNSKKVLRRHRDKTRRAAKKKGNP